MYYDRGIFMKDFRGIVYCFDALNMKIGNPEQERRAHSRIV